MRRVALIFVGAALLAVTAAFVATHASTRRSARVRVFCGAGLLRPMEELREAYQRTHSTAVEVSYAGSGALLGRLAAGQRCDVFLPGDARYVDEASERGWVDASSRVDILRHVPVIAVPAANPSGIRSLADLARPGVRVGLGDPQACAIGVVSDTILDKSSVAESVRANVRVRTATVNELLIHLATGQIDAAIVWRELVVIPEAQGALAAVDIPEQANVVTVVTVSRGTNCTNSDRADELIAFLASPAAAAVWKEWGMAPCGR